jgi:ribonuclease HI
VAAHGVADLAEFRARLGDLRLELGPPSQAGEFGAYTDGACFGNPDGPGGWAAVVDHDAQRWELWGPLSSTSNNRAEALGVLGALEWVPPRSRLIVRADSELTIKILQGLYKARANPDIWAEIRRVLAEKELTLIPEWVPGHAGVPGNELADQLSKLGARQGEAAPSAAAPREPPRELAGLVPQGEWEKEFLSSLARQLRQRRPLTPKQQAVLDRMRARNAR